MLGISTCWWAYKNASGDDIINEAFDLGFEAIELEYRITSQLFYQMKPYLNRKIRVSSIHNYFPKPDEFPDMKASGDLFLLSSIDKEERSLAVKYSIRTIEHANDLEVENVILHLGRVEIQNPVKEIKYQFENKKITQEERDAYFSKLTDLRASKVGPHLDSVLFSLDKLNREAEKKDVYLGIENRYYPHEMPDFEEIGIILKEFEGGRIRYWHDIGHAAVQENFGICKQKELLERYSKELLGVHIHDVKGIVDHLAPGSGELDYDNLFPLLGSSSIKIMELESTVEKEEVIEGLKLIREKIG
jgi:sugar phosphate isomerase/epimerase